MFNRATQYHTPPTYLSSDHDPLYRFHQWQANPRILDVRQVKTVPSSRSRIIPALIDALKQEAESVIARVEEAKKIADSLE